MDGGGHHRASGPRWVAPDRPPYARRAGPLRAVRVHDRAAQVRIHGASHPSVILSTSLITHGDTMTAKLDKSIKRELEIDGKTYTIAISPEGVKVTEKGRRNGPEVSWRSIISGDTTLNANLNASVDATAGQ